MDDSQGFVLVCAYALVNFSYVLQSSAAESSRARPDAQIVTDKRVYRRGSTIDVEFVIKNTGDAPLYFFPLLTQCSSQIGSFDLQILDKNKNVVTGSGCSSDFYMPGMDVVKTLTGTEAGMVLAVGEVYRHTDSLELPKIKGKYQLVGEIAAPSFDETQKAALAEKHMRVMVESVAAPIIAIYVK
jgi:hypothetical protein